MADPIPSEKPFSNLDGRHTSLGSNEAVTTVIDLVDADEALAFLTSHPNATEISIQGNAILDDPKRLRKLIWKIDLTIAPLLAAVYFLQYLDKTTLSYAAVMGIRTDTHLKGQDYSNLSMLFYIGKSPTPTSTSGKSDSIRFPSCRIPNPVPRSTYLSPRPLPRNQHYALGFNPRLPRSMHHFRRACDLPYSPRYLRVLRSSYPRSHHRHVVQERRTRSSGIVVLRLQFPHSDLWWVAGVWC